MAREIVVGLALCFVPLQSLQKIIDSKKSSIKMLWTLAWKSAITVVIAVLVYTVIYMNYGATANPYSYLDFYKKMARDYYRDNKADVEEKQYWKEGYAFTERVKKRVRFWGTGGWFCPSYTDAGVFSCVMRSDDWYIKIDLYRYYRFIQIYFP